MFSTKPKGFDMVSHKSKFHSTTEISTDIDGVQYTGKQVVYGNRVKYQTIIFNGIHEMDSTRYPVDRQPLMRVNATLILSQVVRRWLEIQSGSTGSVNNYKHKDSEMEKKREIEREIITVRVDDTAHEVEWVIEEYVDSQERCHHCNYRGLTEHDGKHYPIERHHMMHGQAIIIAGQLVRRVLE